jgi:hypothetical protein
LPEFASSSAAYNQSAIYPKRTLQHNDENQANLKTLSLISTKTRLHLFCNYFPQLNCSPTIPQKVQIARHGAPGHAELSHEVGAIGRIPTGGTIPHHLDHAPDPVILRP